MGCSCPVSARDDLSLGGRGAGGTPCPVPPSSPPSMGPFTGLGCWPGTGDLSRRQQRPQPCSCELLCLAAAAIDGATSPCAWLPWAVCVRSTLCLDAQGGKRRICDVLRLGQPHREEQGWREIPAPFHAHPADRQPPRITPSKASGPGCRQHFPPGPSPPSLLVYLLILFLPALKSYHPPSPPPGKRSSGLFWGGKPCLCTFFCRPSGGGGRPSTNTGTAAAQYYAKAAPWRDVLRLFRRRRSLGRGEEVGVGVIARPGPVGGN